MSKTAKSTPTKFECTACGAHAVKWTGKCMRCGAWDSLMEIKPQKDAATQRGLGSASRPQPLNAITLSGDHRLATGVSELDRVLGGGITEGSLLLLGGDPGIGKSTLLLQMMTVLETAGVSVLYISGEESPQQIKMRSQRLNRAGSELPVLCETDLHNILKILEELKPKVLVIDSIQTMYHPDLPGAPGAETQLREITLRLMMYGKTHGCSIFLVGHVTKGGQIAGPKLIEHMVDTVMYFEGESHNTFRVIRTIKNRFGATNEIGVFEMGAGGLIPVENPSASFVQHSDGRNPGSIITCTVEGSRPILIEIQALVNKTTYSNPQRVAMGLDSKRLTVILALLERFAGIEVGFQDVFISVAGGLKVAEPAADMAIAAAVASNHLNKTPAPHTLVLGELGLNGDLRPASQLEARIKEAVRLGFTRIVAPPIKKKLGTKAELLPAKTLSDALDRLWD